MVDIKKKMIKEIEKVTARYLTGKTWRIIIYGKHGAIMGRSGPFKFIQKKLVWYAPQLTIPIKKTGYRKSVFMVSGRGRWDITKNAKWDCPQVYGTEIIVDGLNVLIPEVCL